MENPQHYAMLEANHRRRQAQVRSLQHSDQLQQLGQGREASREVFEVEEDMLLDEPEPAVRQHHAGKGSSLTFECTLEAKRSAELPPLQHLTQPVQHYSEGRELYTNMEYEQEQTPYEQQRQLQLRPQHQGVFPKAYQECGEQVECTSFGFAQWLDTKFSRSRINYAA